MLFLISTVLHPSRHGGTCSSKLWQTFRTATSQQSLVNTACVVFVIRAELREQYETATADLRAQLKARNDKINELMESAAHNAADLEELRHELETVSGSAWGCKPAWLDWLKRCQCTSSLLLVSHLDATATWICTVHHVMSTFSTNTAQADWNKQGSVEIPLPACSNLPAVSFFYVWL